jgi:hypothetical protein
VIGWLNGFGAEIIAVAAALLAGAACQAALPAHSRAFHRTRKAVGAMAPARLPAMPAAVIGGLLEARSSRERWQIE